MKVIVCSLLAGLLWLPAALAQQPAQTGQQPAPTGNVENGKKSYMADGCYQCHGVNGDGAALTGPKLSQTGLPYEAFVMQLRKPSSEMPPYEAKIVPEQTAADLYAFLKAQPKSPEAKDLPLLNGMGVK